MAAAPARRRRSHRGLWTLAVMLIVLAAVGFGTLRGSGMLGGGTEAERRAAELAHAQAQLRPQIAGLMRARAVFFAAERRYLPAMTGVRAQLSAYNRKLAGVEAEIDRLNLAGCAGYGCSRPVYPDYPVKPVLKAQIRDLKVVVRQTSALHDAIIAMPSGGDLLMAYSDLLGANDLLGRGAKTNLAQLRSMLGPDPEGIYAGGPHRVQVERLRRNSFLSSVRRMNVNLVRLLDRSQIPVRGYDLPGGRDRSRDDHSTSR